MKVKILSKEQIKIKCGFIVTGDGMAGFYYKNEDQLIHPKFFNEIPEDRIIDLDMFNLYKGHRVYDWMCDSIEFEPIEDIHTKLGKNILEQLLINPNEKQVKAMANAFSLALKQLIKEKIL